MLVGRKKGCRERGGRENRWESTKKERREGETVRSYERLTSIVSSNAQANLIPILIPILIPVLMSTEDFR
jgi:hypothetical protein